MSELSQIYKRRRFREVGEAVYLRRTLSYVGNNFDSRRQDRNGDRPI